MRTPFLLLWLLALACAAALPAQARRARSPYRAAVEVSAAPRVGEATLREDVAGVVTARLRARACLAAVGPAPAADADLRVLVHFEDLQSETTFGTSLAQSVSPDAPPDVRENRSARLRATLAVELTEIPGGREVATRRLTVDVRRSPRMPGDDAEAGAREEALEQIGDRVALAVCKATAKASAR